MPVKPKELVLTISGAPFKASVETLARKRQSPRLLFLPCRAPHRHEEARRPRFMP